MIVRIVLKAPNNTILHKTFFGVTAQVDPQTYVLQLFDKKKRVIAQYPSGSYLWWQGGPRHNCPCRERGSCSNRITGT